MKKLIFLAAIMSSLLCTPAFGQEMTSIRNETEQEIIITSDTTTMYSTANLNIRSEPHTESVILGNLPANTEVNVITTDNGWSTITLANGTAFVSADYLSDRPVINKWGITLSAEEKDLLARIAMLESGNQCDRGQQAVMEVILNRMKSDNWPDTLYSVLSQKRQFSTWKLRNSQRAVPTEKVLANMELVLNGHTNILPSSTVYFSRNGENGKVQEVIEDHIFCNE